MKRPELPRPRPRKVSRGPRRGDVRDVVDGARLELDDAARRQAARHARDDGDGGALGERTRTRTRFFCFAVFVAAGFVSDGVPRGRDARLDAHRAASRVELVDVREDPRQVRARGLAPPAATLALRNRGRESRAGIERGRRGHARQSAGERRRQGLELEPRLEPGIEFPGTHAHPSARLLVREERRDTVARRGLARLDRLDRLDGLERLERLAIDRRHRRSGRRNERGSRVRVAERVRHAAARADDDPIAVPQRGRRRPRRARVREAGHARAVHPDVRLGVAIARGDEHRAGGLVAQDDGVRRPNAEAGDADVDGVAIRRGSDEDAPAGFRGDGDGRRGRSVGFVIVVDDADQGRERRGRGRTRSFRTGSERLRFRAGPDEGTDAFERVGEKNARDAPRRRTPTRGVTLEFRGPLGARGFAPPLGGVLRRARVAQRKTQPVGLVLLGWRGARRIFKRQKSASPETRRGPFRRRFGAARPRRRQ